MQGFNHQVLPGRAVAAEGFSCKMTRRMIPVQGVPMVDDFIKS